MCGILSSWFGLLQDVFLEQVFIILYNFQIVSICFAYVLSPVSSYGFIILWCFFLFVSLAQSKSSESRLVKLGSTLSCVHHQTVTCPRQSMRTCENMRNRRLQGLTSRCAAAGSAKDDIECADPLTCPGGFQPTKAGWLWAGGDVGCTYREKSFEKAIWKLIWNKQHYSMLNLCIWYGFGRSF